MSNKCEINLPQYCSAHSVCCSCLRNQYWMQLLFLSVYRDENDKGERAQFLSWWRGNTEAIMSSANKRRVIFWLENIWLKFCLHFKWWNKLFLKTSHQSLSPFVPKYRKRTFISEVYWISHLELWSILKFYSSRFKEFLSSSSSSNKLISSTYA